MYAKKEDCLLYKIGDQNKFKYVNNQECYEISLIELTRIKKPVVRTVYLLPEVDFEIVKKEPYLVCNYNDYKFIAKEIAQKYNINYTNTITVDDKIFVEVNEEDTLPVRSASPPQSSSAAISSRRTAVSSGRAR